VVARNRQSISFSCSPSLDQFGMSKNNLR
jgi:hypothetical protein